tara:strand:- start:301 stop:474 length:174 start_codon:yes stop_codon:yes gene_type:complete
MENERQLFEDAVQHFVALASLVAVQMDQADFSPELKDEYCKRLNWLVHTGAEYQAAK